MSEQTHDVKINEEEERLGSARLFEHRKLMHDLRNSLSPILMQAQLLARYAETDGLHADAIKKSAESIERSVKEMVRLLDTN